MASIPSTPDHLLMPASQLANYAQVRAGNVTGKKVKFGNR
jgi:hypothetical protein